MNTVKIYRLEHLSNTMFQRLKAAHMEAAQVWNLCMETHKAAREAHAKWPGRNELQQATKGMFALHSQSVQMIVHAFLANVETARQRCLSQSAAQPLLVEQASSETGYPVDGAQKPVS